MTKEIKKDIAGNEIKVGMKVAYRYYGNMRLGYVRKLNKVMVGVSSHLDDKDWVNVHTGSVVVVANPEENGWKKKAEELQAFINESLDGVLKGLKSND